MIRDEWWEVQAQLARLSTAMLAVGPSDDQAAAPIELLTKALGTQAASAKAIALHCATKVLSDYPVLLPSFIEALLELPAETRAALLSDSKTSEEVSVVTADGGQLAAHTLTSVWPKLLPTTGNSVLSGQNVQ